MRPLPGKKPFLEGKIIFFEGKKSFLERKKSFLERKIPALAGKRAVADKCRRWSLEAKGSLVCYPT